MEILLNLVSSVLRFDPMWFQEFHFTCMVRSMPVERYLTTRPIRAVRGVSGRSVLRRRTRIRDFPFGRETLVEMRSEGSALPNGMLPSIANFQFMNLSNS